MYSLTLWLGIPGERRLWLEQWRGIPLILKNLSVYFPTIKVYVDGMTAYDGERIEVANNLEAFWKIVENTQEEFCGDCIVKSPEVLDNGLPQPSKEGFAMTQDKQDNGFAQCVPQNSKQSLAMTNATNSRHSNTEALPQNGSTNTFTIYGAKGEKITLKSLSGYDYRTKICYGAMCDIAISETSTTSLVPFEFCKLKGVGFFSAINEYQAKGYKVKGRYLIDTKYLISFKKGAYSADFHIPPEHLYNLAAEALEELALENKLQNYNAKNPLKMHRLPVPPVELYAKKYQLEQKTKIQLHSNPSTEQLMQDIAHQKTFLELESLELDIELKKLQIQQFNPNPSTQTNANIHSITAKERMHNHLAYKLGSAMILNSKSLWGYIRMPYVLSYIKESHREEQRKYQARIAKNPSLKLPKLESYPDYQEAIKEKQCFTYKLGVALMQADRDWFKGGYLRFYFKEVPKLKRGLKERK